MQAITRRNFGLSSTGLMAGAAIPGIFGTPALAADTVRHGIQIGGLGVLAINPSTLLMDEPFGALDSLTRSIMQDFLLELWEEQRKTVLLVTHDIDEAIYLADRTVVMTAHPGRICEVIDVDLPRPRKYEMRSDARFIALRDHVTNIVRTEAINGAITSEAA